MIKSRLLIAIFAVLAPVSCTTGVGGSSSMQLPEACADIENVDDNTPIVLNQDYERRDQILGISVEWGETDVGGVMWFDNINLATVAQLYEEKFIDPSDRQNASPTAKELIVFMCKYPSSLASGYAVSPTRDDYRVTIDAIQVPSWSVNSQVKSEFENLCENADELYTADDLYCWWD